MEIIDGKDLVNMKFIKTEDGLLKEYKPNKRFIPKDGETYWYIDAYDLKCYCRVYGHYCEYYVSHNLVFRTKEECKDYKWFLDTLDEYKTDFTLEEWEDDNVGKYEIYIDHTTKAIGTEAYCNFQSLHGYYFTKENVHKFIVEVGEKRIRKYMFNIWE